MRNQVENPSRSKLPTIGFSGRHLWPCCNYSNLYSPFNQMGLRGNPVV